MADLPRGVTGHCTRHPSYDAACSWCRAAKANLEAALKVYGKEQD